MYHRIGSRSPLLDILAREDLNIDGIAEFFVPDPWQFYPLGCSVKGRSIEPSSSKRLCTSIDGCVQNPRPDRLLGRLMSWAWNGGYPEGPTQS